MKEKFLRFLTRSGEKTLHREIQRGLVKLQEVYLQRRKPKVVTVVDVENEKVETFTDVKLDLEKNYSFLMEEVAQFPGNAAFKEGLKCLGGSELGKFNESWRLQQIAEGKISVQRVELIHEQTKLILEAIVSSTRIED